jgi:hypothetical protein
MGKNISGFSRGVEFYVMMRKIFPFSDFLNSLNTGIIESRFFFVIGIVKKFSILKTIHKYLTSEI